MENKTLCIVGACKDVAPFLPKVLENVDRIASWWKECKIVIFENDSTDGTKQILQEWKEKGGHKELVQETNVSQRYPHPIERLAYIRNRLLHYVPPSYDYMFMVDMDDVFINPVQKESFESCFELKSWDVMTANGVEWYYDIWPLRVPGLIEFDCWKRRHEMVRNGYTEKQANWEAIEKYKEQMFREKQVFPVHSAYNTGALYKVSSIHTCCRFAGSMNGEMICEHVPFQNCLRSHGARILFNPNFRL